MHSPSPDIKHSKQLLSKEFKFQKSDETLHHLLMTIVLNFTLFQQLADGWHRTALTILKGIPGKGYFLE